MSKVFVSHAAADSSLVDEFVSRILDNGCGLDETQIFYSSGRDTGVPSGYNLLSYVQQEVSGADLVIAIVSPMFQTRPVCLAELGALWHLPDSHFNEKAQWGPREVRASPPGRVAARGRRVSQTEAILSLRTRERCSTLGRVISPRIPSGAG